LQVADLRVVAAEHVRQPAPPDRDGGLPQRAVRSHHALSVAMKNLSFIAQLSWRIRSLRRDQRGVSAGEIPMLLPLIGTLYLGTVEISQAVSIHRKVTLTARTLADLASQVPTINNSDMTNILNAAAAVVAPFPSNQLQVVVSAVSIDGTGAAKVTWSDTLN